MFPQDGYCGTLCPSSVLHFNLEAVALANGTSVGNFIPPLCSEIPLRLGFLSPHQHFSSLIHDLQFQSTVNYSDFRAPPV